MALEGLTYLYARYEKLVIIEVTLINHFFMSELPSLPIAAIKAQFCQALSAHNTIILSAPPGAGKSTCLPLWLLEHEALSEQKIYLLQPRRLAVKTIAMFLANQLDEPVGKTVGYRLRHDVNVSTSTRLEVITEGILTQLIQQDPELSDCALVVFDEFHERSLQGDLAFALSRDIQLGLREELKIVLMSATLDIESLQAALPEAVVMRSEGKSFPVDIIYDAPKSNVAWRDHAFKIIANQALNHHGSILVFLPGVADIRFLASALAQALEKALSSDLLLCPLYGNLTLKQQQQAIEPCKQGSRKLVLATNIAETSLTIEGINLVIDCGFEKVAIYDNACLMNKLVQKNIAKASAIQRAGRAGRLMAGKCIRLYAQDDFARRPEQSVNEIKQADLLPTIIESARWGVNSLAMLPFIELPLPIKEEQGWQGLRRLAIVDSNNKLTDHGEKVSQFPCHPRFAHMIISSQEISLNSPQGSLTFLACVLTSLLEEKDIFSKEQSRFDSDITHRVTQLISVFNQPYGPLVNIVKQVNNLAKCAGVLNPKKFIMSDLPLNDVGMLLAYAYPERVAKARGSLGDFVCANGKGVTLYDQDVLASESFLVIADLMEYNNISRVSLAARIELSQLKHIFKEQIFEEDVVMFDEDSGRLIARRRSKLEALVLQEVRADKRLSAENISIMWCEQLRKKGLTMLNWQVKDLALKARWQWLNSYFPEYHLPAIDDETLLKNLAIWFSPFVGEITSMAKLSKVDLSAMLLSQLDYQQQQILNHAAPSVYIGPTGRHCVITYSTEKSPKVSLPMQELYGESETPTVGGLNAKQGIPLLLELLSPAQRPIQVTQDLVQFWRGSYKAVQKDMKSRYPKHFWPDDPANALPTNKTKRHLKAQN